MIRTRHSRLRNIAWIIFIISLVTGMFSASFFLTAFIYKAFNLKPSPLLIQIINSFLGLIFTGLTINAGSRIARARGWVPEMPVFKPIIEALERIAKGDFSIHLEDQFHDERSKMFSELASTVNNMAQELSQMEALRQEFISNVSHEIQSPLTSIRGFAEALQNERLSPEERRHYLSIIESESTRLSRLSDNLLRLAALESDKPKFEPKSYRLDKQIRNLILACEPQWMSKHIELDVAMDEVEITADEDLLSQVWVNLINNSIKFSPAAGKICVKLRRNLDHAEFEVSDTGIGISAEDRQRVFERFYKADKSRQAERGGSGLGLAIAKKIVEMHSGEIGVKSVEEKGAIFFVRLPLSQAA